MEYEKIYLFGKRKSRGSFDDFYDIKKFNTIEEAYNANDYVECDFVKDKGGWIHIEARHVQDESKKKYHRLNFQHCPFGLDVLDDSIASEMATTLFLK